MTPSGQIRLSSLSRHATSRRDASVTPRHRRAACVACNLHHLGSLKPPGLTRFASAAVVAGAAFSPTATSEVNLAVLNRISSESLLLRVYKTKAMGINRLLLPFFPDMKNSQI